MAKVRDGQALAAVVIPAAITQQIESLVTQEVGSPTVYLYLNTKDPIEKQFVDQAISSRLSQVDQLVSNQVLRVAVSDLLGLRNARARSSRGRSLRCRLVCRCESRCARWSGSPTWRSRASDSPARCSGRSGRR